MTSNNKPLATAVRKVRTDRLDSEARKAVSESPKFVTLAGKLNGAIEAVELSAGGTVVRWDTEKLLNACSESGFVTGTPGYSVSDGQKVWHCKARSNEAVKPGQAVAQVSGSGVRFLIALEDMGEITERSGSTEPTRRISISV